MGNMKHMPKGFELFARVEELAHAGEGVSGGCGGTDAERLKHVDGEGTTQPGERWSKIATFEAKTSRGWQSFASKNIEISDPQQLCDAARDPSNQQMHRFKAKFPEGAEGWNVDEPNPNYGLHNAVE